MSPHPVVTSAAGGTLPDWARMSEGRRRHAERVAELMTRWAEALELPEEEIVRWRAAALLHDALRDEEPTRLRALVPEPGGFPEPALHGPAVARLLRDAGVRDEGLLRAIAFHTVGHPELDRMGLFLYAADWMDPDRPDPEGERAALRDRMPAEWAHVLPVVAAARIGRALEHRYRLLAETAGFWNRIVDRLSEEGPEQGTAHGA